MTPATDENQATSLKKPALDMTVLGAELHTTYSDSDDRWLLALSINGMAICYPRMSDCGRFDVDPSVHGLTEQQADMLDAINSALDEAIQAGLNEACRKVQEACGVEFGDEAAMFFSDSKRVKAFGEPLAEYMAHELNLQLPQEQERPAG